ncbi:OLC1v1028180C2 [Oldenlandia corymbosa var. corymbosa]|uniref:OLC1v1028180C2 n=1 Tax=Oldenlandia corymbosa var. corymbosa TaxID=529605 RepID=A0AAV1CB39_OLDCO|nr:OLC1v1028180C2 [Oldenlandia corymbosa var. corymbosa]
MGSLKPLQFSDPYCSNAHNDLINPEDVMDLFRTQQRYLNYFFENLDSSQTFLLTQTLQRCKGTIFFTGVGKSGIAAQKISKTRISIGIKSEFLSPVDALHGDIGILSCGDVLVMFKKEWEFGGVSKSELCRFGLAPVTSTAIQIIFGDTVATALTQGRNFSREMYAANHPAGRIGKSLIFKVEHLMKKKEELPVCKEGHLIVDQLVEVTSKGCGCLLVVDDDFRLLGTFTDGDLRRTIQSSGERISKLTVGEMCNRYSSSASL